MKKTINSKIQKYKTMKKLTPRISYINPKNSDKIIWFENP